MLIPTEGLYGCAYLRALAGRIGRVGGPDAAHGPPVGQRWPKPSPRRRLRTKLS